MSYLIGRNGWPFRIVTIEDSIDVRGVIKAVLETSMDMAVVGESDSGSSAIALVQLLVPDVIVLGPSAGVDKLVDIAEAILDERPSTMVLAVRDTCPAQDQVILVRAGVLTVLELSQREKLPNAIRRADQIREELHRLGIRQ